MGYESRLYIVEVYSSSVDKQGFNYAEVIGRLTCAKFTCLWVGFSIKNQIAILLSVTKK